MVRVVLSAQAPKLWLHWKKNDHCSDGNIQQIAAGSGCGSCHRLQRDLLVFYVMQSGF